MQGLEKQGTKKLHKHLFRLNPPQEFVEEILRHCGFEQGLSDRRYMSKGALQQGVRTQELWLPFLEPYYLPCKAERFFGSRVGPLTTNRLVTILRHILRPYAYDFVAEEVAEHGTKQTLYQIRSVVSQLPSGPPEMEVVFS
jgi:hypothetical protein